MLASGIDVYTTVNIQHIESLNDVIAQITRIRVRETVPDEVLDEADEIELVDTTADDLLQRLKEGKVYVKAQAERALRHFFSPGNLTALRELALRKTAQRVDRDMTDYMQAHAIAGPWSASDHILVCVNEHPSAAELMRRARASPTISRPPGPRSMSKAPPSRPEGRREGPHRRHAASRPAPWRRGRDVPGRDIAQAVLDYARKTTSPRS